MIYTIQTSAPGGISQNYALIPVMADSKNPTNFNAFAVLAPSKAYSKSLITLVALLFATALFAFSAYTSVHTSSGGLEALEVAEKVHPNWPCSKAGSILNSRTGFINLAGHDPNNTPRRFFYW